MKMSKATPEKLNSLHDLVADALTDVIKGGKATPQHLAAAIKFLKDNHIEGDIENNTRLKDLKETVFPDFDDEEDFA